MLGNSIRFVTRSAALVGAIAIAAAASQAQVAGVANTGAGLTGGSSDPFWHYISGDATSNTAATGAGAVVLSEGNIYTGWPTRASSGNTDRGWIASNDAAYNTNAPLGLNTMRIFVDLTGYNLSSVNLAGNFWADDCTAGVFVNGHAVSGAPSECGANAWQMGGAFAINQTNASSLFQGVNSVDFIYNKTDQYEDGVRVDFTTNQGRLGASTTPEPSSMALLGTGLIGLVPMVRRRRK